MKRAMIQAHLAQAERHVLQGERHVERQREIILLLCSGDHCTVDAERLLGLFEEMQQLHVEHRDRLLRELNDLNS